MNWKKQLIKRGSQEAKLGRTVIKIINPFNTWFKLVINVLAVMTSWYFNKSILWALFHWSLGTSYLIYSLLIGRFSGGGFMDIVNSYF